MHTLYLLIIFSLLHTHAYTHISAACSHTCTHKTPQKHKTEYTHINANMRTAYTHTHTYTHTQTHRHIKTIAHLYTSIRITYSQTQDIAARVPDYHSPLDAIDLTAGNVPLFLEESHAHLKEIMVGCMRVKSKECLWIK